MKFIEYFGVEIVERGTNIRQILMSGKIFSILTLISLTTILFFYEEFLDYITFKIEIVPVILGVAIIWLAFAISHIFI